MTAAGADRGSDAFLTIPNLLTLLRLALIPFFVAASLASLFTVALVLFVTAGVTDVIDGYLARRLDQRSRVGAILDPAADKLMMFCGYVVFTFQEAPYLLPSWLTFTVFIRDFLIAFFAYLLHTRVHVTRFPPSVPGKISTLLQVVTLSAVIAANTALRPAILPLLEPLFLATLGMTLFSGWDYMRRTDSMLQPDSVDRVAPRG